MQTRAAVAPIRMGMGLFIALLYLLTHGFLQGGHFKERGMLVLRGSPFNTELS